MFNRLRHSVRLSVDKKLSKADTLRSAIQYIEHLKKMLENGKIEIVSYFRYLVFSWFITGDVMVD